MCMTIIYANEVTDTDFFVTRDVCNIICNMYKCTLCLIVLYLLKLSGNQEMK